MRAAVPLLLVVLLPGCEAALGPAVAVNAVSLMVTGRAVPDLLVSGVTGRDCSIAYLDAGERYCRPEAVAVVQPFCTRSLGGVDCWNGPVPGLPPPRPVADAAPGATPEPWPARLF
ncbi:hypothetical protein ACE7GA_13630 [Roseomonas sp. CCTCC AB2023176]|uniref:hypothetical protein n=1 Tax=Roseomonas sp. CCTCC AB2023176 TaxID=3342640 RepID=UPI0035E152DF